MFGEIHEKLERVLDGKEKVPRVEFIKAEASPLYECRVDPSQPIAVPCQQ